MNKPEPIEQLIADIAAGEDDSDALAWFEQLAAREPQSWRQLALALRDELHMVRGLERQLDGSANRAVTEIDRAQQRDAPVARDRSALRSGGVWSGWAVAAALVLALIVILPGRHATQIAEERQTPAALAAWTAQEALDRYLSAGLAEGRVLAELPTVMVEARPTEDGRLEVLYLRQLLERERVSDVYAVAPDEHGLPHPVKVNVSAFDAGDSSL